MDSKLTNSLYQGVVRDGVVVFVPGVSLPEGTTVTVKPEVLEQPPNHRADDKEAPIRNGVPLFPKRGGMAVTLDIVNSLRDDGV
ncbi:hypothetical protein [Botrimarina mediterranea]|uniref:Uncharacterized protein n=1 Tax=Botrimarina mediterranea TaxID=2528022 RepID=A0A518K3G5_9BACT|nr:hypothetical protein [Botrimarina mediterranea]QDV72348.1 hypothetical protein Spa11_05220 [Botrimarina mediterranea]QDV76893.1 hypothetical protein K2D_04760 [Planctomycetes bacterium K2D]